MLDQRVGQQAVVGEGPCGVDRLDPDRVRFATADRLLESPRQVGKQCDTGGVIAREQPHRAREEVDGGWEIGPRG